MSVIEVKVRPIDEEIYQTISQWWQARQWPTIPRSSLPKSGFMGFIDGKPILAAYLYATDSDIGLFEWVISAPDSKPEERDAAFQAVAESIFEKAKEKGLRALFSYTSQPNLSKRFLRVGFIKTDDNISNFLKMV